MISKTEYSNQLPTIYYITHFYKNPKTGGERYIFEVTQYLRKKGFDIRIFEDKLMPKITKDKRFLSYNLFYIIKFLDAQETVVFTTDYMHPRLFLFFLFLRFFKKSKIFVLVQHFRFHFIQNRVLRSLDKLLDKAFLRCADIIIGNSENTKFEVKELTGKHTNIFVVRPGIKRQNSKYTKRSPCETVNILFMGDCLKRKGLEYLIESLQLLNRNNTHLHIAGNKSKDPAFTNHLIKLIKEKNLEGKVTLHGWVEGTKKLHLFASSHIFVLPTLWEGYGQAIAEAMSFGLPVIATEVGAVPELVKDGVNGILVPPKDPKSLAQAISYLIDNPTLRETYGKQGQTLSQKFSGWQDVGKQFEKIFLENIK